MRLFFLQIFFIFLFIGNVFSQTFSSSPSMAIPDNGPETCSSLTVSGVGNIDNSYGLEYVTINISHTWDADLDIYLVAPDGTRIELTTDNGGRWNNYQTTTFIMTATTSVTAGSAPFNGSYLPEGDLGDVNNGQNANGSWQLCITDDAGGDVGTLNSWSITFSSSPAPKNCNWKLALTDDYGDGWQDGTNYMTLDIYVNGVYYGPAYITYAASGNDGIYSGSQITFDIDADNGDIVDLVFNPGTQYNDECAYYVYDDNYNLIHSEGTGGAIPGNYSFTVSTSCQKDYYTTGDCNGAVKVCTGSYSYAQSAIGDGAYEEIAGRASCWGQTVFYGETAAPMGENNSTWYVFDVQTSGTFQFSINQNISGDDYDWVLFNITGSDCSGITDGSISDVACNWEVSSGSTGMNASGNPAGWETGIAVSAGETYVLVVDNFTTNGGGYTLNLNNGTAVIFDNVSPQLSQVTGNHFDTIWFDFSEPVECSSVSTADFSLDGPNNPYTINTVQSTECNGGASMSQHWFMTVTPGLQNGANYTLNLVGDVNDQCTNPTNYNNSSFLPVELVSFTGKCTSNGTLLKWKTLSEENNNFYTLSKSNDGVHYSELAKIDGAGTSNETHKYSFLDEHSTDNNYYKLSQTDFDGTTHSYKTIYLSCIKFINDQFKIYPNPALSGSDISIKNFSNNDTLEIFNLYGQKINVKSLSDLPKGNYIVKINSTVFKKLTIL